MKVTTKFGEVVDICLVPKCLFFKSLARNHPRWKQIRERVKSQGDGKCSLCRTEPAWACHEVWQYDDVNHVQKLVGLRMICRKCNLVFHQGYARTQGLEKEMIEQFTIVTGLKGVKLQKLIGQISDEWSKRSVYDGWTQDVKILEASENE